MSNGAKEVHIAATHGLFSDNAAEKIQACSHIKQVYTTNSVNCTQAVLKCNKLKVIDAAPVLAEAIRRVHNNESVSTLYMPTTIVC